MPSCHVCGRAHADLDSAGYCCFRASDADIALSLKRVQEIVARREEREAREAEEKATVDSTQLSL